MAYAHALTITGLAVYGLNALIRLYLYHRREPGPALPPIDRASRPHVTVQVPAHKGAVIDRAIYYATAPNYSRKKLHVQALDDQSTDDTNQQACARVTAHHASASLAAVRAHIGSIPA